MKNFFESTFVSILIIGCSFFAALNSTCNGQKVYKINIKQEIGPGIWRQVKKGFGEAEKEKADYIIIAMNTYGGTLEHADSIRTLILNSKIPVFVFIDNNAASAGALIAIACDSIYMREGANIGAATVVDQKGEVLPDKYQSYMRSMMRSTAEASGRDPEIAQAMVDAKIYIKGISDSGQVLTFTTNEAIKHGFCEGKAESVEEVLKIAGITDYNLMEYIPSQLEKLIGLLVNPFVSSILIMIIIGGIYFELQTPGIGFPIIASIIAATLYFSPLYLEGLAENWEIVMFLVGLILIAIEVLVIPGFGVAGIIGFIFTLVGLALALVNNIGFDFSFTPDGAIIKAFVLVVMSLIISVSLSLYFGSKLLNTSLFSKMVLAASQPANQGFTSTDMSEMELIAKCGLAATVLRPSGKVEIEGVIYDAIAEAGYIEKDEKITVIKFASAQLVVRKSPSPTPPEGKGDSPRISTPLGGAGGGLP